MQTSPAVYVSLTGADQADLLGAAKLALAAGADGIHLDLGDGVFVPTLTFGPSVVVSLRRHLPHALLDVHLMVAQPARQYEALAAADRVCFHTEATRYPWREVTLARRAGIASVGVALNPATGIDVLDAVAHGVDFVNVLSTEPDAEGERLLPGTEARVWRVRDRVGPGLPIVVDGGVTVGAIGALTAAGANEFVVGRAVTGAERPRDVVEALKERAAADL